jgi:hypothetical protein
MTLASPLGIAAGRSPSCAVPPIMTLMTAEQEFWKSEFGLRSGIRCSQALARELLRVPPQPAAVNVSLLSSIMRLALDRAFFCRRSACPTVLALP